MSRKQTPPIFVIGLSAAGPADLPPDRLARIQSAALLVGGRRQLSYFPDFKGETLAITTNIEVVVARLQAALRAGAGVVVLASGDPLCYGIGATLRRYLPPEQLEIVPAPSAFQLAFAALAEPWAEAALLSAHARPLSQVVAGVRAAPLAAILTDNHHTPAVIAEALQQAQLAPDSPVAICENLGGPGQRLVRTCLAEVGQQSYAPLNVFVIWPRPLASTQNPPLPLAPGLPDEAFATSAGQLTKREVRLLSLAELALGPNEVMWDIGAGSGAVSIEAGRAQPTARLYAVEKRATLCEYLQENLRRFPTPNLHWVEGVAPAATTAWPDPDAVFIGGSGGRLAELIGVAQQRLRPGGRLVLNLATLEHLHLARTLLPSARLIQAQFSRGVPILELLRFEALNPIFIVAWQKER